MVTTAQLEYVNCNLCEADDPRLLYRIRGAQTGGVFDIVRCRVCGLVYTNPRLRRDFAATLYNQQYYAGTGFDPAFHGTTTTRLGTKMLLTWVRNEFLKSSETPRLADVGGGQGAFVAYSQELGYDALLVEQAESCIQHAREQGLQVYHGEITDPFFQDKEYLYDVISAWEVLEHVYGPMDFLKQVYRLLKPGGLFIYSTGNVNEARLWRGRWGYFQIPEGHVYFYSPKTMTGFLQKAGFKRFLDPYWLYHKETAGVRFLTKVGLLNPETATHPESLIERALYSYGYKWLESLLGRRRLPFAVK